MRRIVHQLNINTIGGVEYLLKNYLENRHSSQLQHHVFATNGRIHPYFRSSVERHASTVGYLKYWHGLKLPKTPGFLRTWNAYGYLNQVTPHVVVSWNRLGGLECLRARRRHTSRFVYYDHGASWLATPDQKTKGYLSQMDELLCCSYAAKRILELRWGVKREVRVICNPVRPDLHGGHILPKTLPQDGPLILGVAGRLIAVKGICLAVQAVALLKQRGMEVQLRIAGEGPSSVELQNLVRKLRVEKEVQFLGAVRDIRSFYQTTHVMLCPSLREPFSLVCLEAMAFGCPVICSCVDGLPEVVSDGRSGFCLRPILPLADLPTLGMTAEHLPPLVYDPENDTLQEPGIVSPEAIASGVERLWQSPEGYRLMSQAAMSDARDKFTFGQYVTELEAILVGEAA